MSKSKQRDIVATPVPGGVVKRDERSGRFIGVTSNSGTYPARERSAEAVRDASERRREALKRLADR